MRRFGFNVLIATKLLKISDMRNFLNVFLLTFLIPPTGQYKPVIKTIK